MGDDLSWKGHWKTRLHERVRDRGFASLTAFAERHPTRSLVDLADELGEDVNAVQVFSGLVAEAERSQQLTRLVRAQFAREFAEGLPEGWPPVLDDAHRFKVARTLGLWVSYTPSSHQERARRVGDALLARPPPTGWRPLSSEDRLLRALLPDEEA
ncbi:NUDIX hydrolase [Melittangium boletus]|uniref:NUDIX hydrolase n=1 Tax=Melittangium boletus TaxID=83453 RepID=UPI003DA230AD